MTEPLHVYIGHATGTDGVPRVMRYLLAPDELPIRQGVRLIGRVHDVLVLNVHGDASLPDVDSVLLLDRAGETLQ